MAGLAHEQPLEIQIEGNFDGFYQFLLELETLPRITQIHQLKLERAGAKAMLVGESLMRQQDVAAATRALQA